MWVLSIAFAVRVAARDPLFFPGNLHRLLEDFVLHRLAAEGALEFSDASFGLLELTLGHHFFVGLEALLRRVVHDPLPLEQKTGRDAKGAGSLRDGAARRCCVVEQSPFLLGGVSPSPSWAHGFEVHQVV